MILFHGTNVHFETIDINKSKIGKDFGRGFYLSDNFNQAMELAKVKVAQLETGSPIVLSYEIEEEKMKELNVLRFDTYSEDWAKFIIKNRNNKSKIPVHDYDIVIGPIANDRVGYQLWKYDTQQITLPILVKNLRHMKGLTIQYFFGTERAIQLLKKL